jgi:hypothetical protein
VLERSDGRKLCVDRFALGEEGHVKTGFHVAEA